MSDDNTNMPNEQLSRRKAIVGGAAVLAGGGLLLAGRGEARAQAPGAAEPREGSAQGAGTESTNRSDLPPGVSGRDYTPVVTPNGVTLEWRIVDGWKVGHLVVEEVDHEFAPGLRAKCWGYNGRTSGPTIEAVEGDRLRIYVTNRLYAPTTIHWHGILLPNGMDGVTGLNQRPIQPGETFKYEFTLRQSGTHMYHSHFDEMTQQGMGLMGMFVIHPRKPVGPRVDRDFAIMLSEWRVDPGASRPNTNEMTDFNVLTMNSKAFPGTDPLVVKQGERVRIRFGNLGAMDHHPIHLHGYEFRITETDGGRIPEAGQEPANAVLVAVGQTRAIEFVANEPGDWAMHCHMTHHVMNQMGHGTPNMVGVDAAGIDDRVRPLLPAYMTMGQTGMGMMGQMGMKVPPNSIPMVGSPGPFGYIDMGGMFTLLKVRKGIVTYDDPGWYRHPPGTVADRASDDELRRDGIDVSRRYAPTPATPAGAGHGRHSHGADTATPPAGTTYVCPMHPKVTSDNPDRRCPTCGMMLAAKE
jgi:FtsP/CotA-like multicopper oxidase with cupredoxin domain